MFNSKWILTLLKPHKISWNEHEAYFEDVMKLSRWQSTGKKILTEGHPVN